MSPVEEFGGAGLWTRNEPGPDLDPMKAVFCFHQIYVAMEFSIDEAKAYRQLGCLSQQEGDDN